MPAVLMLTVDVFQLGWDPEQTLVSVEVNYVGAKLSSGLLHTRKTSIAQPPKLPV